MTRPAKCPVHGFRNLIYLIAFNMIMLPFNMIILPLNMIILPFNMIMLYMMGLK